MATVQGEAGDRRTGVRLDIALVTPTRIWRLLIESMEIILALHSIALGAYLLLPFNTFGSSRSFVIMAAIAPEWVWGGLIFALGTVLFVAVLVGSVQWRLRILILLAHIWLVIALALIVANYESVAVISYVFFSIIYIATYLRLAATSGR